MADNLPPASGSVPPAPRELPPVPPPTQVGIWVDQPIERELGDSYLTYAMSVIVDRALPDVRDGLKPSQRRILVAMHDLNLTPGRKHSKCAGIVGETMKRYHPHGDMAIYPTLVNMAQEWKTRALLIDKQGNFGSVDPDPPAAMRYTEARLHANAMELLADLKMDTVDWQPNFDDQYMEPKVLPARLPNLLINGSTGIAVGMACSMAPHNPIEICNAIIASIDNPEISLRDLMAIVPGPDFPSGGMICGRAGVAQAYATGRGRVVVRAKIDREERNGRNLLVVKELPYQVSKNDAVVAKIKILRADEKLQDIAEMVDESSNRVGMRLVITLKKNADPEVVLNQLYQLTPLQDTFSLMHIAMLKGQPRTLGLRDLIRCWIDHRIEVIRRRTEFLLHKARTEAHRIEGLIYAICDIDEVIKLIRSSRTRDEAIERLQVRGFRIPAGHVHAPKIPARFMAESAENAVILSRVQAETIGRLQLIQLVGLEIEKLVADYAKLLAEIEGYEAILASDQIVLDMIKDDLRNLIEMYGVAKGGERPVGERRTVISMQEAEDVDIADLIPEETVAVTCSQQGYVKRLPIAEYRTQNRGGKGVIGTKNDAGDLPAQVFVSSTHDDLLCFTNTGRVFRIRVFEIPEATKTSKGRNVVNLLNLQEGEKASGFLAIKDFEKCEDFLVFITKSGVVKHTALSEYRNINARGINAVNLRDGDALIQVLHTKGNDHLLLGTQNGIAIRFEEEDARLMGRAASGVRGIDLADDDAVVGAVRIAPDKETMLLTLTEKGYGKRTPTQEYLVTSEDGSTRVQSRGGKGRKDVEVTDKNGRVVAVRTVEPGEEILLLSAGGQAIRTRADEVRLTHRGSQGVRVMNLDEGDKLVAVASIAGGEETQVAETPAAE